jgi:hypothetical protein
MEATVKLDKTLQNPNGKDVSFNFDLTSNLIITSKANGEIFVTLKIDEVLEDAYCSYLSASLGV